MVKHAALVSSAPHRGACCVGVWTPSWWGVLRWGAVCYVVWRCVLWWCVAPRMVGRAALVYGPAHGGAVLRCVVLYRFALRCDVLCCVLCGGGVWPPLWWGVLRWCVAPLLVGRAALGCGVLCSVALCVVVVCGPFLVGRALVSGPPHGRAVLRCLLLRCVVLRCCVLCCVVLRCVVCGGGLWPFSWSGVLRWGAVYFVLWR